MSRSGGRSTRRRNLIGRSDARAIRIVAAVAAVGAVLSGCTPTGVAAADALWCGALAAIVAWSSASSPWWAVVAAAFITTATATTGPLVLFAAAATATGAAVAIAWRRASAPVVRAAIGAVVANVVLRSEWEPFALASATAGAAVVVLLVITGVARRPSAVRRRAVRASLVLAGVVALASVGLVIAGVGSAGKAADGYTALSEGLGQLGSGETGDASQSLADAAEHLSAASDRADSWWAAPARLLPVLAPQRDALDDVSDQAAATAASAGAAIGLIDPTQLQLVGGAVDVDVITLLTEPLDQLTRDLESLVDQMTDARSPWILPTVARRLDETAESAATVITQVQDARSLVQVVPDLFGASGDRRYLVAFTNPAEARGQSGVMGNWSELTASGGRITLTASGRTTELIDQLADRNGVALDMPDDYLARFASAGAVDDTTGTVDPRFWSNVTMSADMPSVGRAMAQMYAATTGRTIDAVAIVDPTGVSALLSLTGPVQVDSLDTALDAASVGRFLTIEQYERPETEREAILEDLTRATMDALTDEVVVDPVAVGDALGRAAVDGHVLLWLADPSEQTLVGVLGIDGALPRHGRGDGLAVTIDNAGGNKIDSFLHQDIDYRPVLDPDTGTVTAHLRITLRNDAPTTGYEDYVIGNLVGLPVGTNRALVNVHTPLRFTAASRDGEPTSLANATELGWNVFTTAVDIPAGETATLEIDLVGSTDMSDYSLVVRPQQLPNPTAWHIEATDDDGHVVAGFVGGLEQRSTIDGDGLHPWLPGAP